MHSHYTALGALCCKQGKHAGGNTLSLETTVCFIEMWTQPADLRPRLFKRRAPHISVLILPPLFNISLADLLPPALVFFLTCFPPSPLSSCFLFCPFSLCNLSVQQCTLNRSQSKSNNPVYQSELSSDGLFSHFRKYQKVMLLQLQQHQFGERKPNGIDYRLSDLL